MKYAMRLVLALIMAAVVTTAMADDKAKSMTAQGKVTAVTGDSLTVMKGAESMTFTVDSRIACRTSCQNPGASSLQYAITPPVLQGVAWQARHAAPASRTDACDQRVLP